MQELRKISSADLAGKLHTGQADTPDIGADGMQALFDAHPNLNTDIINANAEAQNANNAEIDAKLLDLDAEDAALGERIDLKADTAQVNAKFAELDAEDELLHQRIDAKADASQMNAKFGELDAKDEELRQQIATKANDAEIKGILADVEAELESKANASDVLTKDNATEFAPTADYHPATKKYVDDLGIKAGAVTSVFGRAGAIVAQAGDYTAEMVGARPADWMPTAEDVGAAPSSHSQSASTITAGTLAGQVGANGTAQANIGTEQLRNIYAGTADLTAGSSALTTGTIYFVYE